jgi:DNA polymerase V
LKLNLYLTPVKAGFPSPADDYIEKSLDINDYLVKNPDATFLVRAQGDSMKDAGIISGDILVVDRSVRPVNNCIVLAVLNSEFTVKKFYKQADTVRLVPENSDYKCIIVKKSDDFEVWGVVTASIRKY